MRPTLVLALLAGAVACSSASDSRRADSSPPPTVDSAREPTVPERTACTGLTVGPGTYDWTVQHGGRTRAYRVHVPPGYDATRPTPAVLAFHGFGSDNVKMETLTGLSSLADTKGFIAIYPRALSPSEITGSGTQDSPRSWNAGGCCFPARGVVDDVGFVDALLADLDTRLCVDTHRTYAMGFSNGGYFTYRLACERASRFAAVAPVSGPENVTPCTPSRPVPVLHFHGTADALIHYAGGNNLGRYGDAYPGAEETVRRWAKRNGCGDTPVRTFQKEDSTCMAYTDCTPRSATASLCTVQGGEHAWPGQANFNHGTLNLDATREAWRFFEERPRP
ncbi:dienelactone hydrolase family protein [Pyxidicoccus parkwayensis]|uniref:Dienelactone hydrolase family protein n=1 Tax=Pyxidicoccus parkwayensis TaxID=2813578 RepID=A0ABX7NXM1_9BACT|nr:PHB depolymerase family esterase [Pyxidicoccus parkwaysis]QSQ23124.1 dienelactone hydrolase family protein [Pyxidicoccus parkwaysis]